MKVADTVKSFREIVDGKHDDLPEQAFYMVAGIDSVLKKAGQGGDAAKGQPAKAEPAKPAAPPKPAAAQPKKGH